jgi:transposase
VAKGVQERARGDPRALLLATIPGVGRHTALLILAEVWDIYRIPSASRLGSYAGVVPSTCASGGKARLGAISTQGSHFLRWALAEADMHAVRTSNPLEDFYQRLLPAKAVQQARVGAARKLCTAVYWMLVPGRTYTKVEPYLAPRGQANSAPFMASG